MKDDVYESMLTFLVIVAMMVCFGLGAVFGVFGGPPQHHPSAYERHRQLRRACMPEQHAVVSQWRVWTEKAAAAGECRGHVLMNGDEP